MVVTKLNGRDVLVPDLVQGRGVDRLVVVEGGKIEGPHSPVSSAVQLELPLLLFWIQHQEPDHLPVLYHPVLFKFVLDHGFFFRR